MAVSPTLGVALVAVEPGDDDDWAEEGAGADVVGGAVGVGAAVVTVTGAARLGAATGTCPMTPCGLCSSEMCPGVGSKETQPSL